MKKNLEDYRPGAIGSLLDEYERAVLELKSVAENVARDDYTRIADPDTADLDCRSIETIMNHVVRAGFGYARSIRERLALDFSPVEHRLIPPDAIGAELEKMFAATAAIFAERPATTDAEITELPIAASWGVTYNIDQMLEHAIVHVLRHRRQIEKFLLKFRG